MTPLQESEPQVFVPRRLEVRDVEGRGPKVGALSSFSDRSTIVVLGDPGAGKTQLFRRAALHEGGEYLTVRQFRRRQPEDVPAKPLFLDGLDEVRRRTDHGRDVFDDLLEKLQRLRCAKIRISCRASEWYGGLDTTQLREISSDGQVLVLSLLPLTRRDIKEILKARGRDPEDFLRQMEDRGHTDWLRNPQTLELLLAALDEEPWPDSRRDLFKLASRSLVKETNPEHSTFVCTTVSDREILKAAQYLCAVHLAAGIAGYSLEANSADADFPFVGELVEDALPLDELRAASGRRVFHSAGSEHVAPVHRTMAEFLGAQYLTRLLRAGFPLNRILALITGDTGGVPSDLRGLYAWLVCLEVRNADLLLQKDPLGILVHADPSILSIDAKAKLLSALQELAERDLYFEDGRGLGESFRCFAEPNLAPDIQAILEDAEQPWTLTRALLEGLAIAPPLPGFGDLLLEIARDSSRVPAVVHRAAEAFCATCPERTDDLLALLKEIDAGVIDDATDEIRYHLLTTLYPQSIDIEELVTYLEPAHPEVGSLFTSIYLPSELPQSVPAEDLPRFLDALAVRDLPEDEESLRTWQPLVAESLVRCLEQRGDELEVQRLYQWLELLRAVRSTHWHRFGDPKVEARISSWLEERPTVFKQLFRYGLLQAKDFKVLSTMDIGERFLGATPPGTGRFFLHFAAEVDDNQLARDLFRQAIRRSAYDPREQRLTVDEVQEFLEQHSLFEEDWNNGVTPIYVSACPPVSRQAAGEDKQLRRDLTSRSDHIRAGTDRAALRLLATTYFNLRSKPAVTAIAPRERLRAEVGSELTEAACEGFVASILKLKQPKVSELGHLNAANRLDDRQFIVLAGLDLLWETNPSEFASLPSGILSKALVYHLGSPINGGQRQSGWVPVILERHPSACEQALLQYWRPALERRKQYLSGLLSLQEDRNFPAAVPLVLLEEFPRSRVEALQALIIACLAHQHHDSILKLAREQLEAFRGLRTEQFLTWLATAFLLDPAAYGRKLLDHAPRPLREATSPKRVSFLRGFIGRAMKASETINNNLPAQAIEMLILACTRAYPHLPLIEEEDLNERFEVPQWAKRLIERLGGLIEDEARDTLLRLRDHPDMEPWRDTIRHTLEDQAARRREVQFQQPSLRQVVELLRQGSPASAADLFALVSDHLETQADEIRNGRADTYKMFWNLNSYQATLTPIPEESCRDRLMDRLIWPMSLVDVSVGRESYHVDRKRADLRMSRGGFSLPVECKLHFSPDLWRGIEEQLIPRYARDPQASGHGAYVVFWFGLNADRCLPKPPSGIDPPRSATELQAALEKLVPRQDRGRVFVCVIDVSPAGG